MLTSCPASDRTRWHNRYTGELVLHRCRRLSCAYCCPIEVGLRGQAIRTAVPHSLVTLTQMGEDGVTARKNVKEVVARVRRRGYCLQHAYTFEPPEHPDHGAGLHVHAWVNGDHVPERVLEEVCWDLRIGEPDVEELTFYSDMTYGMKRALDDDTRADHLRLNGGRLVNNTHEFFRDRSGSPCSLAVAIGRRRP